MGCEPAWPDCYVTELRIADPGGRLATPACNPQFFSPPWRRIPRNPVASWSERALRRVKVSDGPAFGPSSLLRSCRRLDVWKFEGPAFHAWATRYFADLAPVHRFWSERSGSHLYTIDQAEKDALLAHPSWTYEGVAFHAYPEGRQPDDSLPVYRFWNPWNNWHLYTIDPHEAQRLLTQYQDKFIFEGAAFYVYE